MVQDRHTVTKKTSHVVQYEIIRGSGSLNINSG